MAVIVSKQFANGYTPICGDCGIALCFDIDENEYDAMRAYWDNWKCETCNPHARGSWLKARIEKRNGEKHER